MGAPSARAQAPPKLFELQLPEFGDQIFEGDVIELPVKDVSTIVISLLNPVADRISYGQIYSKLNGDASTTICQYGSTDRGKFIRMNLKMRRDIHLRPGSNALEITATDQRGRRYYKNFILRTREDARNEWFAYETAVAPGDETGAPPDVLIVQPEFPVIFEPNDRPRLVRVKGTVNSAHPIAALTIQNARWTGDASGNNTEFEQEVTVSPKDSHIEITATDQSGNRTRISVPVVLSGQRAPSQFTGERYALVVGISRFGVRPGGPPDLYAASSDAENIATTLESQAGFRADHVLVLRDENATAAKIRNAFRHFVALAKPDDLMLIYVSSHGLHDPLDANNLFLAAYDTQMKQLSDTSLGFNELEQLVSSNVRSRHAVLAFDVGRKVAPEWRIAGSNLVNNYLLKLFSKEEGRAVLVSGGLNEVSVERPSNGGYESVFARAVVEALQGKADWNQDRQVTVAEMFRYISSRVRSETNGSENPRFQIAQELLPIASLQAGSK